MITKTKPFVFFRQVRSEVSKIKWPDRRETSISTFMVLVMIVFASTFFFLVDWIISFGIRFSIGFLKSYF